MDGDMLKGLPWFIAFVFAVGVLGGATCHWACEQVPYRLSVTVEEPSDE